MTEDRLESVLSLPKKGISSNKKKSTSFSGLITEQATLSPQDNKKRATLIHHITEYWDRFPECGEDYTASHKVKFIQSATISDLEAELKRCIGLRARGFSDTLITNSFFTLAEYIETVMCAVYPPLLPYRGTIQYCKETQILEDDLSEAAIYLDEWLRVGPFVRILIKIFQAAAVRKVILAVGDKTEQHIREGKINVAGPVSSDVKEKFASL
ncbi:MAG: hypothetical protein QW303_01445 [Nitrososphaerota archaeon]